MRIEARIEGVTPLLMNRVRDAQIEGKSKRKGEEKEQAIEDKLYLGEDGKPYLPAVYFVRALVDAGKRLQVRGQKKATYSKIVGSVLSVEPEALPLQGKYVPFRISAVNPMTKGRMMVTRPRFDKWGSEFEIIVEGDSVSAETINALLVDAGKGTGIGDWRPEKKGKFGKFIVTRVKLKD